MYFDTVDGTFTSFLTNESITDPTATFKTNYFTGWRMVISGLLVTTITSNTATTLNMGATIPMVGTYQIKLITKEDLAIYSDQANVLFKLNTSDNDTLILNKYEIAKDHFNKLLKSKFPYDNAFNLIALKDPFIYYTLFLMFSDNAVSSDSFSQEIADQNKMMFKETIDLSLQMLQIDSDLSLDIDENESKTTQGQAIVMDLI